jgi:fibro-slime domain-containing protein
MAGSLQLLAPQSLKIGLAYAADPPATIELTGTVRDFIEHDEPGGHPDFECDKHSGRGLYQGGMVETTLGADGKPVYNPGGLFHVMDNWEDSSGRPISWTLYDPGRGDTPGTAVTPADHGCSWTGFVQSQASFDQWFRDTPGVNLSAPLTLTFVRQVDGTYVFDDKLDPLYNGGGGGGDDDDDDDDGKLGFFPIDNQLFGNSPGSPNHNYHFTFELHCRFTYDASAGHIFEFIGDDDVWVFIDGELVIDRGGDNWARQQFVELDRLGLVDGQSYPIDIFFAERRREDSNIRITTTLDLENVGAVTISMPFD